ncbi:MAG: phage late control D family protein [Candidatus Methylomirabilales bacterium]
MAQQQEAATVPAFTVRVDGSDLPPAARGEVAKIIVEESLDSAGTFAIELNNWDMDTQQVKWSDATLFQPGGVVEIQLGYVEALETVMVGEITGLELSFPEHARALLTVRGYDRLHRFRRGRRTRSYLQVKDSDVAQQIASDLGLTPDVEDSGEVHPYLLQMNQTDIDFLLTRARAIGYELLVEDKTLRFRKVKHDRGKVVALDFTHGLMTFYAYLSTADQVSQVTVRGWDLQAKQALVGQAQASDVSGTMQGSQVGPAAAESLFGARTLAIVEHPVATQNEADLLAKGLLNDIALGYIIGEGTAVGDPAIKVGTVIELDGLGERFRGLYYLTQVVHVWDGQFVTRMQVRRNAA